MKQPLQVFEADIVHVHPCTPVGAAAAAGGSLSAARGELQGGRRGRFFAAAGLALLCPLAPVPCTKHGSCSGGAAGPPNQKTLQDGSASQLSARRLCQWLVVRGSSAGSEETSVRGRARRLSLARWQMQRKREAAGCPRTGCCPLLLSTVFDHLTQSIREKAGGRPASGSQPRQDADVTHRRVPPPPPGAAAALGAGPWVRRRRS